VTNSWRDMGRGLSGGEGLILVSGVGQGQRYQPGSSMLYLYILYILCDPRR
jgi:hypothetical protein